MIYCKKQPLISLIKICEDKLYMQKDLSVLDVVMRNVLYSLYLLLYICITQWDVLCKVFIMFVQAQDGIPKPKHWISRYLTYCKS